MKTVGIIAEYNPIHSGHIYHIKRTREVTNADTIVAVISGSFTQRGEPAFLDKWTRAKMAVLNGVDLCLEMPYAFAANSAEQFAEGGIKILNGISGIDYISFGCEAADKEKLLEASKILCQEPEKFKVALKENLTKGNSFPKSRELALREVSAEAANVIGTPNNILAVEYLKWLEKTKSLIEPIFIKREGSSHHKSATDIRRLLLGSENEVFDRKKANYEINGINKITEEVIKENSQYIIGRNSKTYFELVRYSILQKSEEELEQIYGITEGLENRLKKVIRKVNSMDELVREVKSKRYTETSINRMLLNCLIGFKKEDYTYGKENLYTRVLAFNQRGSYFLKKIKKEEKSTIPIFTNIDRDYGDGIYREIKTTDIYNIAGGRDLYKWSDYIRTPYVIK